MGDAEREAFSTSTSLRRNALERELRVTARRLRELDDQLGDLGRARTRHAGGAQGTGGVGTVAVDVRSDEERALGEERDRVAARVGEIQAEFGKLRTEVATRFGGTPPWWVEPRSGR